MDETEMTPGQLATLAARRASIRSKKLRAAERHLQQHVEALELLGWTCLPPDSEEPTRA